MIPVKLTICGLYSYRLTQTIDFTNLTNAGLFGLFGGVGSGKSTILEAISFALYGESERLNSRDNRNYNMMNLKSNDLLIDFEFKTGIDSHYRFVVSGKRNSKRFEEVKSFERMAYKLTDGSWIPLESASAEQITGLTYNNFKRTIIIPQGKFQEFLQLSAKDRTVMLQELFNLEKFELSSKVASLEFRNNEKIQNLQGQLQSVENTTPEQLTSLQTQLTAFQEQLKTSNAEQALLQAKVQEQDKIKLLHQKHEKLNADLAEHLKQEKEITALDTELKEYENIIHTFQSDIQQLHTHNTNIGKARKDLADADNKQAKTKIELDSIKQTLDTLKPQYDNREQITARAMELANLIEIKNLQTKHDELKQRIEKGKQALLEKTEQLATLKTQTQQLNEQHAVTRQKQPDVSELANIKEWFTNKTNRDKSIAEQKSKTTQIKTSLNEMQNQIASLISKTPGFENIDTAIAPTELQTVINNEKQIVAQQLLQQQETKNHLEVQNQLKNFASQLTDGAPCPLCGSAHHPHVLDAADVSLQLVAIKKEIDKSNKRDKELAALETELAKHQATISAYQKQLTENEATTTLLEKQATAHIELFIWKNYSPENEKQVADAFELVRAINKKLDEESKLLETLAKQTEQTEKEKEKFDNALKQFEQEQVANTTGIQTRQSQLILINANDYSATSTEALSQEADSLKKQHQQITTSYLSTEKQYNELLNMVSSLTGQADTITKNIASLETQMQELQLKINSKLAQTPSLTIAAVESVMQKQINITATRQRISEWTNSLSTIREMIKQTAAELGDKTYDAAAHLEYRNQLNALMQTIEKLNQSIGDTSSQIKRIEKDLIQLKTLRAEMEQLQTRATDLSDLSKLFRGSGFVNYISTVYLQNLCSVANQRFFHLTRQHLSLQLADDNSFMVLDYMNEGKLRSVKTLSGGQTFQASLSLALALADSIRHLSSGHENFFFLDEGFGTLDKESLNIVFETLKSLRKENRIVGVISHVEEMQQEIDTYLMITNHEESGSMVTESWK